MYMQLRTHIRRSSAAFGLVALAALMTYQPASADPVSVTAELTMVSPDGRNIEFAGPDGATVASKVSGSRTKIMIGGAESTRENLKVGMNCDITYEPGDANEPSTVSCK